jgi:hypothetical protein
MLRKRPHKPCPVLFVSPVSWYWRHMRVQDAGGSLKNDMLLANRSIPTQTLSLSVSRNCTSCCCMLLESKPLRMAANVSVCCYEFHYTIPYVCGEG